MLLLHPPRYLDHKGGCCELTFLLCTSSKGNNLQLFHRRLLCFGMCFSINGWYKSLGESTGVLGLVGRSLVQQLLCVVGPINQYWVLTIYTHDTPLSENCSTSAIGRLQPGWIWSVYFLMLWLECGVSPLYSDLVMLHLKDHPLASCTSMLLPLQYISSWLQSSSCSDGMYAHCSQRQTHHSSKNCLTCLLQKSICDNVCENLPWWTSLKKYLQLANDTWGVLSLNSNLCGAKNSKSEKMFVSCNRWHLYLLYSRYSSHLTDCIAWYRGGVYRLACFTLFDTDQADLVHTKYQVHLTWNDHSGDGWTLSG